MTPTARLIVLAVAFATPARPRSVVLARRQPDPKVEEYVFDVPVPADLAAKLSAPTEGGEVHERGAGVPAGRPAGRPTRSFRTT